MEIKSLLLVFILVPPPPLPLFGISLPYFRMGVHGRVNGFVSCFSRGTRKRDLSCLAERSLLCSEQMFSLEPLIQLYLWDFPSSAVSDLYTKTAKLSSNWKKTVKDKNVRHNNVARSVSAQCTCCEWLSATTTLNFSSLSIAFTSCSHFSFLIGLTSRFNKF